jgi:hypothetical protein
LQNIKKINNLIIQAQTHAHYTGEAEIVAGRRSVSQKGISE